MKEGRCFRCRQQGHMVRECPKMPPRTQTQARATDTKKAEAEEAPPYSPEASTSSVSASTSEDKVRKAHALLQSMDDEEKRRYYALDQDFLDADLCVTFRSVDCRYRVTLIVVDTYSAV